MEQPKVGAVAPETQKESEKAKEIFMNDMKVAEVLLGDRNFSAEELYEDAKDGSGKVLNQEKAKAVKAEVETSFSPKALEQAREVVSAREANEKTLAQAYELKKQFPDLKKKGVAEVNATEQQIARERHEQAVVNLKKTLIEDEITKLRVQYGTDPNFEKLVKEKIVDGVDGTGRGSRLEALRRLSVVELARMNEAKERVDSRENSRIPEGLKKTFGAFSRIKPRALRSIVGTTIFGAAIVGAGVAFSVPVVGAAAGYGSYFAYRALRAVVGGSISGFIQKHITNRIVESAYQVDVKKAFSSIAPQGEQNLIDQAAAEDLLEMGVLEDVAERTFATDKELAEEYSKKMKTARRLHTANLVGSSVITGAAGGLAGAKAIDFGAGHVSEMIGATRPGAVPHDIPEGAPKPVPAWESSVAGKGDSVWKVVEHDLDKNIPGFRGMTEAQRTYIIDHYKDYVEANPEKFGLSDPDQIKAGWGRELDSLFTDKKELAETIAAAKGLRPEEAENILRTNEWNRLHPHGITPEAAPASAEYIEPPRTAFSPEDQRAYGQAMENYRGGSFTKGTPAWDEAHLKGEQELLKLAEEHPDVMQNPVYQEFKVAVRGIYAEHLQGELGEGGMFKFIQSADHEDLMRETAGLARTFGLKPHEAQMYAAYLAQGGELDEMSFKPFVDPESGQVIMKEFARSIGQFGAIVENNHDLPEIPAGKSVSAWEPRMIRVGNHNYLGLVRNIGEGKFEYSVEPGEAAGASKIAMEVMLEEGTKQSPIEAEVAARAVAPLQPIPVKGIENMIKPVSETPMKLEKVQIPEEVETRVAEMQAKLPEDIARFTYLSEHGAYDAPKPIPVENYHTPAPEAPMKLEKVVIPEGMKTPSPEETLREANAFIEKTKAAEELAKARADYAAQYKGKMGAPFIDADAPKPEDPFARFAKPKVVPPPGSEDTNGVGRGRSPESI